MFAFLDAALTGKKWAEVLHTAITRKITPEKLFSDAYYLSDGGYSRIGLNIDTLRLFICDESLDKPKENWANCKELISDIERVIKMEMSLFE